MTESAATSPSGGRIPVLLVTGMSGAGKSTALKALEDLGYEAVDNMPLSLLQRMLKLPDRPESDSRPIAIGIDTRTRAFDAADVVARLRLLRRAGVVEVSVLFLDCSGGELTKRFSETRRRHPLALDRPAADGIAREREILAPLRRWADMVIDTTDCSVHDLRRAMSARFGAAGEGRLTLSLLSFGYSRGLPRDADIVLDVRFLSNPHWVESLRPLTGQDERVGAHIAADSAFAPAFERMACLLETLLPSYAREGRSYLTVAFGCTGGRHRSVYVTEAMATRLRSGGYDLAVVHRDISGQTGANDAADFETARRAESMRS